LYDPAPGTFIPTGPMNHPRESHTATLLRDGRVLIAGGDSRETAEVYDPHSGAFTATGNTIARCGGTRAALLADGQALIAGHECRYAPSANAAVDVPCAELYNPRSGTFNGLARAERMCHFWAMTNLKDARTLLAGGSDDCDWWHIGGKSAELYFPALQSFRPTGEMNVARSDFRMTLLRDGRVLVTGGVFPTRLLPENGPPLRSIDSAEIYDPATGRFTTTGEMTTPRAEHVAVVLP